MSNAMQQIETHRCFDGNLTVWEHQSTALSCVMRFSIFLPFEAKGKNVPALTFLSGLTCTYQNFTEKAGAYRAASEAGIAIIAPDTSPRGNDVPDDMDRYDFGQGAGFYINATKDPWDKHYQMEQYIAQELHALVGAEFPINSDRQGICGHSMGGHGALTFGLKYPEQYTSISAFSPIVAPSQVPWGRDAFTGYLGSDENVWAQHDATALMTIASERAQRSEILIDQGLGDQFLSEQLKPELFAAACKSAGQALNLRMHEGHDHSYYFIQSFMDDHIHHHANILKT